MTHVINEPHIGEQDTSRVGAQSEEPTRSDDSGYGLAMFVIFSAAALIVTGAVALLALVGSWWMLGAAIAVHVGMTSLVIWAVIHAIGGPVITTRDAQSQSVLEGPRIESGPRREAVAAHL